jgi:hypothetical protein
MHTPVLARPRPGVTGPQWGTMSVLSTMPGPPPEGTPTIDIDLGDAVLRVGLVIPGVHSPRPRFRYGPVKDRPRPLPPAPPAGRPIPLPKGVTVSLVLQADKLVTATFGEGVDEVGNVVPLEIGSYTATVADPSIITLTDDGAGTVTLAAAGPVGTTSWEVSGTLADGTAFHGVDAVEVTAGDIVGVRFAYSAPVEVTPDDVTPTPAPEA